MHVLALLLILNTSGYGYDPRAFIPGALVEVRAHGFRHRIEYSHTQKKDAGDGWTVLNATSFRLGHPDYAPYVEPSFNYSYLHTSKYRKAGAFIGLQVGFAQSFYDVFVTVDSPLIYSNVGEQQGWVKGVGIELRAVEGLTFRMTGKWVDGRARQTLGVGWRF